MVVSSPVHCEKAFLKLQEEILEFLHLYPSPLAKMLVDRYNKLAEEEANAKLTVEETEEDPKVEKLS